MRWPMTITERFWCKTRKGDACWLWTASRTKNGYGQFYIKSKNRPTQAHKMAWELTYGPIPAELRVLHKCDVRHCVNPSHLFLGTQQQNIQDMITKKRGNTQVLSIDDVLSIRTAKEPNKDLATQYGVSISAIYRVKTRATWSHV